MTRKQFLTAVRLVKEEATANKGIQLTKNFHRLKAPAGYVAKGGAATADGKEGTKPAAQTTQPAAAAAAGANGGKRGSK